MLELEDATEQIREQLFDVLYGERQGYVMIASMTEADRVNKNSAGFKEKPFLWPEEKARMLRYISQEEHGKHVWFTPLLYDKPHRRKTDVAVADIVWADLEECHPDSISPSAPIVIQSSPGRYQAIWKLEVGEPIPAHLASNYSRRIAEQYKHLGADTSGADLAQLLRVPGTYNYKGNYVLGDGSPPRVGVITLKSLRVPEAIFAALPPVDSTQDPEYEEIPDLLNADDVIEKHKQRLRKSWHEMFSIPPEQDWSKVLWRFLQASFEAGMTKQEVFSVANEAACNKFKRDGYRPGIQLWSDVLRAEAKYRQLQEQLGRYHRNAIDIPNLYDATELQTRSDTFVDRYIKWASTLSDAPRQYHELCGFIVLSAVLSGNIKVESSFGDIVPNIWGMILADSTVTRKSTAMDFATELVESIPGCDNILLATDGSMEGIFKAMSNRSGEPSLFKKDEVQGFMAGVAKKDYMAGMLDGLAKLYDGKTLKRQLAKESITVRRPIFIMLAGGIKTKMFSMLTPEHVESGFLPRFLFVTAETNLDAIRPLGPRQTTAHGQREELRGELSRLRQSYCEARPYKIGEQTAMAAPDVIAELDEDAWARAAEFEMALLTAAYNSTERDLYSPMLSRFYISTLKCACLLAATRQEPHEDRITISRDDVVQAIYHTSGWLDSMLELLSNLGRTAFEGDLQRIWQFIQNNEGVPSGAVMRNFHLSAREMGNIMDTLEGRGLIDIRKEGKGKFLFPVSL